MAAREGAGRGEAMKLVAFVKRDCPTCVLVVPALAQLAKSAELVVYSRRTTRLSRPVSTPRDDTSLEQSWRAKIEAVPTLLRVEDGREVGRAIGWHRGEWEALSGVRGLAPELPARAARLRLALGRARPRARPRACASRASSLRARRVELADAEDEHRGDLRARLERRPAGRAADRSARARDARRHDARARRDRRDRAARPRAVHASRRSRSTRSWRAASRSTCRSCSRRSRRSAPTTFNIHGVLATTMGVGADRDGQRADPARARHELGHERARPGQPRELDDRPRAAARGAQRRRRPARRGRPRDLRQPRQGRPLLRRGRGALAVDAARRPTSASSAA